MAGRRGVARESQAAASNQGLEKYSEAYYRERRCRLRPDLVGFASKYFAEAVLSEESRSSSQCNTPQRKRNIMPKYIDGFLLTVPRKNLSTYVKMSSDAGKIWKKHGALQYRECAIEDEKIKGMLPFAKVAKPKRGETIIFSWIVYKSRAHRDKVNAKVMKDPDLVCDPNNMPFDCSRMAYGGFEVLVDF